MVDHNEFDFEAIEALYFGYRAFTTEPDRILAKLGLNRAHHRILYFVGRKPDITVGDLLSTLHISKQALSAPLRRLHADALIKHTPDPQDKRVRRLQLTAKGRKLERDLTRSQSAMLQKAFDQVDPADRLTWLNTTRALIATGSSSCKPATED